MKRLCHQSIAQSIPATLSFSSNLEIVGNSILLIFSRHVQTIKVHTHTSTHIQTHTHSYIQTRAHATTCTDARRRAHRHVHTHTGFRFTSLPRFSVTSFYLFIAVSLSPSCSLLSGNRFVLENPNFINSA